MNGEKQMGEWKLTSNARGVVDPGGKVYEYKDYIKEK